jgi:hypothetical protein
VQVVRHLWKVQKNLNRLSITVFKKKKIEEEERKKEKTRSGHFFAKREDKLFL